MRSLLVLALCLGCAGPSANRRAAEQVVWRSLTASDVNERRQATRIVVEVADPLLDAGLPARLGDGDALVRATAAAAMARDVQAAREVLRSLFDSSDAAARLTALEGVTALDDAPALVTRLMSDPDESVRARTVWLLRAPDALERMLQDPTPGVRAEALRALAGVHTARAADKAEAALSDPALSVRLAALSALARSGDRTRLLALAGSADRWVALRAAVQLKDDQAVRTVVEAAMDKRAELRAAALNAAGELGERGRPVAQRLLADPDLEVRLAAARALISSGGDREAARRVLRSALATPYRLQAADELARLGDAEGRRVLSEAAHAPDAATRRAAVSSLGAISPEPPELGAALSDSDAQVRLTAARALLRRALRPYLR